MKQFILCVILATLIIAATGCGADAAPSTSSAVISGEVWVDCPGTAHDERICRGCSLGRWWVERGAVMIQVVKGGSTELYSRPGGCVPEER